MSEPTRTPAVTAYALKALGGPIKEALRSLNHTAAEAHIRDVIAAINNESAWCYDTDPELGHMSAYFGTLHDTCVKVRNREVRVQKELTQELLNTIDQVLGRMAHLTRDLIEEAPPDRHLSIDEIEHRGRRYEEVANPAPAMKVFD